MRKRKIAIFIKLTERVLLEIPFNAKKDTGTGTTVATGTVSHTKLSSDWNSENVDQNAGKWSVL
jgi:hypothetical protein